MSERNLTRAGKPCGIPVKDTDSAKQRIGEGFQLIDVNNDLRFLEMTAQKMYNEVTS